MKLVKVLLFCLFSFSLYAQNEEMEQLLSVQNINISEIKDISCPNIVYNKSYANDGLSFQASNGEKKGLHNSIINDTSHHLRTKSIRQKKSLKFEANSVVINALNGCTFHVADYYGDFGHSRVVTCLEGELRGLQAIADNGVFAVESTNVEWFHGYFVHHYPHAIVYSYQNKQIFKIK